MATIQNIDLFLALRDGAKLPNTEANPTRLADSVIPVLDVTPAFHRTINSVGVASSTSGDVTVLTSSSTRKTFIVACSLGIAKDATADDSTGVLTLTSRGSMGSMRLLGIPKITLTALSQNISITFPQPIEINKSQTVSIGGDSTNTVGILNKSATVAYFEVDP